MHVFHQFRRALLARSEAGQTTAEYALVILGVAVVAGALAIWAKGGAIQDLFDDIINDLL